MDKKSYLLPSFPVESFLLQKNISRKTTKAKVNKIKNKIKNKRRKQKKTKKIIYKRKRRLEENIRKYEAFSKIPVNDTNLELFFCVVINGWI